ncbi:hypothetical protein Ciccas_011432 [Cichlidogyrus casuarinus]|uniref:Uncharacterized protein n=1 Tax=Cichlidogyrus casuarinus TaxID=1844966 RepID=A0ABD2PRN9_9PLAT
MLCPQLHQSLSLVPAAQNEELDLDPVNLNNLSTPPLKCFSEFALSKSAHESPVTSLRKFSNATSTGAVSEYTIIPQIHLRTPPSEFKDKTTAGKGGGGGNLSVEQQKNVLNEFNEIWLETEDPSKETAKRKTPTPTCSIHEETIQPVSNRQDLIGREVAKSEYHHSNNDTSFGISESYFKTSVQPVTELEFPGRAPQLTPIYDETAIESSSSLATELQQESSSRIYTAKFTPRREPMPGINDNQFESVMEELNDLGRTVERYKSRNRLAPVEFSIPSRDLNQTTSLPRQLRDSSSQSPKKARLMNGNGFHSLQRTSSLNRRPMEAAFDLPMEHLLSRSRKSASHGHIPVQTSEHEVEGGNFFALGASIPYITQVERTPPPSPPPQPPHPPVRYPTPEPPRPPTPPQQAPKPTVGPVHWCRGEKGGCAGVGGESISLPFAAFSCIHRELVSIENLSDFRSEKTIAATNGKSGTIADRLS